MKEKLLKLSILTTLIPFQMAAAQGAAPVSVPTGGQTTIGGFVGILANLINWAFYIVLLIAVLFFIYAGFIYITAGGSEDKQKQAKDMIIYAIVGVGIALLAKAFLYLAGNIVGVSPVVPTL